MSCVSFSAAFTADTSVEGQDNMFRLGQNALSRSFNLIQASTVAKPRVVDLHLWLQAWCAFFLICMAQHLHLTDQLLKYQRTIVEAAILALRLVELQHLNFAAGCCHSIATLGCYCPGFMDNMNVSRRISPFLHQLLSSAFVECGCLFSWPGWSLLGLLKQPCVLSPTKPLPGRYIQATFWCLHGLQRHHCFHPMKRSSYT